MLPTKMYFKPYFSILGIILCNSDGFMGKAARSHTRHFLLGIFAETLCPRTRIRKLPAADVSLGKNVYQGV